LLWVITGLNNAHIYYAIIKVQINKQLLVLLHFLI